MSNGRPFMCNPAIKEVARLIALSGKGAQGYGGKLDAAELCNDIFGKGWIDTKPASEIDKLSRKLIHQIFKESTASSHTNVSVVWKKFQESAQEDNIAKREFGAPKKRGAALKVRK